MSLIFTYRDGQPNQGTLQKDALDQPAFNIDFTDAMAAGVTMSAVTYGALDSSNVLQTARCINSVSTSGAILSVFMLTGGIAGTGAAPDDARYKLFFRPSMSNAEVVEYAVYVHVAAPSYTPI